MIELPTQETAEMRQERIKFALSRFLEAKLAQAVQFKKEAQQKGTDLDIVQCLLNVWAENDGVPWQRKPRFSVPDFGEELTVRFDLHSDYDEKNKIMTLNIEGLRSAQTLEQLDLALLHVAESAYHETEHIYTPGSDIDQPEGPQETIEYLGHPGEIEAHARQFAYRYIKEFPGEPFDLAKMIMLAEQIKAKGEGNKHYNYFIAFADPEKQERYKEFGDVKEINQRIIEATKRHLQILFEKSGIL